MAALNEYYNADFNRLLSTHATWKLQTIGKEEFDVIAKVHLDFNSNTKFLSFYIPQCTNSLEIIKVLLGKIDKAIKISDSTQIQSGLPGEKMMNSSTLRFSGRIFFYSENFINPDEFAEISEQLIKQGLFIHYRD